MERMEEVIEQILQGNNVEDYKNETKEEILSTLSVYHEELRFQNEELKRTNHQLTVMKEKYESLFYDAPLPYLLVDDTFLITDYNKKASELFGTGDLKGTKLYQWIKEDSQDAFYFHTKKLEHHQEAHPANITFIIDGIEKHMQIESNFVNKGQYRIACMDQTEMVEHQKHVEHLSIHDQMTDLYNRRHFEQKVEEFDSTRYFPLGFIMADINGLKLINDAFGHQKGDEIIHEVSKELCRNTRDGDVVARLGGDEFAIILPNATEKEVKEVRSRLERSCVIKHENNLHITVSFGSSVKKMAFQPTEEVLQLAENRMYRNKLFQKNSHRTSYINSMMASLFEKVPREEAHSKRVSQLAEKLGQALQLDDTHLLSLKTAGMLHDIGKIAIDHSILNKESPLTSEEYEEVKRHSEVGHRILNSSEEFADIAMVVLSHHEHFDGRGYPLGIQGEDIKLEARILQIAEAYDAMISETPYREALSKEKAIQELKNHSGTQFDPKLVDLFIENVLES
ncbi:sensor domain-containing diguanylate cyclase/phosphohydrolase [Salimicrobium halophilum]|uniref:Diguanylate cyclase (GGDEF) domain-containing protein/HDIG domain-containing protein n=1 Tax=Salimicrobium halophilum TaxID=86666 RepID=A0A1G8TV92_9BACI|nr:diguanylate cyclase [Salimicrobium halophilum]SDJ45409.1 diguanylate cyclase (GGDEF) domain-containing protein/HDIG domain-containing protein [Salimicrobium halophilum]